MYRVLLVDDEDIEREAMARLIPWETVDMELADMAWNGIEALEKIRLQVPDIVITDIKMPVMDGIELIRQSREVSPDTIFVVLSGYGEYEYTSRAMELGIRHYILKPCDEDKIVQVLLAVREELSRRKEKKDTEQEYRYTFQRMLPHVKEQILGGLITKRQLSQSDEILLKKFVENVKNEFRLLSMRASGELDQLDRFVITNILMELLGKDKIFMSTVMKNEVIYLLSAESVEDIRPLVLKVHREYLKYSRRTLCSALSRTGGIREVYQLYCQVRELYHMGEMETKQEFLSPDFDKEESDDPRRVVDYGKIRDARSYGELLFEVYTAGVKMELEHFSTDKMAKAYSLALKVLYGEEAGMADCGEKLWDLMTEVTERCAGFQGLSFPDDKDGRRMKHILYAIYENIRNPELSLQYLAREVLFMNEDYFGRFFYRFMNEKYSAYLLRIRISLAERLMAYEPGIKISELAAQIGYPPDGQYFAKVFRKHTGMSPSEYRGHLQNG